MSETVEVTREVYKELMEIWADIDELPEEFELITFYKDGMPEGWRKGNTGMGTTAGEGEWIRLEDHGTSENWEQFLKEVEKARKNVKQQEQN